MTCGNDNLMGYTTVPAPEPTQLALFLTFLGAISLNIRRRRR